MQRIQLLFLSFFLYLCSITMVFANPVKCTDDHLKKVSNWFLNKEIDDKNILLNTVKDSVVTLNIYHKKDLVQMCSGFVYQDQQHIMTNAHCLLDRNGQDDHVEAVFHDGTRISVTKVVANAGWLDVAVLKLSEVKRTAEVIQFHQTATKDTKVIALPGCEVNFQEDEPNHGHTYGSVVFLNSTQSGKHGFTVNEYMKSVAGKSGALMINEYGQPVGMHEGYDSNQLTLTLQDTQKKYDHTLAIGIQGRSIKENLDEFNTGKTIQNWRETFLNSKYGKMIYLMTLSEQQLAKAESVIESVLDSIKVSPEAYPVSILAIAGLFSEVSESPHPEDALAWYGYIHEITDLKNNHNPFILFSMALIHYHMNKTDLAFKYLKDILIILPYHKPSIVLLDIIQSKNPKSNNNNADYELMLSNAYENDAYIENCWETLSEN